MPAEAPKVLHPLVLWAQRDEIVYVTIEVEDMKMEDLSLSEKSLHIKGSCPTSQQDYECTLEFYGEIDGANYRRIANSRHVELVIPKQGKSWWPRLLKDGKKVPWIKVDFNKWKDEDDESDHEGHPGGGGGGDFDFANMMANLGGGSGGGLPNVDDLEDDSDDGDMPDLEDDDEQGGKSDKKAGVVDGAPEKMAENGVSPVDGQAPTTSGE